MNLLKDVFNPNSDYNKKLRTDGIALITESYEKVIDLLDNLKGMVDDSQGNDYDYAFRTAIEVLKKQIPKEPVNNIEYPSCPSCNHAFYWGCIDKYCSECGQALKWE